VVLVLSAPTLITLQINEAYVVLRDPKQRAEYDAAMRHFHDYTAKQRAAEARYSTAGQGAKEYRAAYTHDYDYEENDDEDDDEKEEMEELYDYGDLDEEGGKYVVDMGDGRELSEEDHAKECSCFSNCIGIHKYSVA